jgi:hypothetical protein
MDERIRRSRKQENDGAKRFGGRVTPRSGAGDICKNDMRTETESVEFKTTEAKGYRLTHADLLTAWVHATIDSRKMIFGVEFQPNALTRQGPTRYVILPEDDYLGMKEELEEFRAAEHAYDSLIQPFEV